ncbi:MAG: hypothetical protein AAGJ79_13265 [Verrucomicrobiota bacterium]
MNDETSENPRVRSTGSRNVRRSSTGSGSGSGNPTTSAQRARLRSNLQTSFKQAVAMSQSDRHVSHEPLRRKHGELPERGPKLRVQTLLAVLILIIAVLVVIFGNRSEIPAKFPPPAESSSRQRD